jgi:peroxiredoxin
MTRPDQIDEGELIPDLPLIDHDGEPWTFSDQHGRPLLLVLHRHLA